jgi:tRNA nucleotidyltransferase/poly(A) polymerase
MRRPSIRALDPHQLAVARKIASVLRGAGHRAWIVGGAVRDLALERTPKDIDMASAAVPDEIERSFKHTVAVGKAFGTIVVVVDGLDVQLTTFRSERGHRDSRRPDAVVFGATPEEDSGRRDFTCNALYLDPLDDTLLDPHAGLADLERGLLRCVGEPIERFREDGLRLVRMARLAAAHGLTVEPETLAAARSCADAIVGVSAERLAGELEAIFDRPRAALALRTLDQVGVLARALPELDQLAPADRDPPTARALRWKALEHLDQPVGMQAGASVLFDPDLGRGGGDLARAVAALDRLKPSRAVRGAFVELQRLLAGIASASLASQRVRLVRDPLWPTAARLARAWRRALEAPLERLDELEAFARSRTREQLFPAPWITSGDLARSGIARGPRWGSLLELAETMQLDGAWKSRDDALAWLAEQKG